MTATFCLLAGGAVMVYSASSARTLLQGQGDGTGYLLKYVAYGAVGLIGMNLVSRMPLDTFRRYTPALLLTAFALLFLVLMPGLGERINGARRWLGFGPLQFQPSEIMKLALVLHAASMIAQRPKIAPRPRPGAPLVLGRPEAGSGNIAPPGRSRLPVRMLTTSTSQLPSGVPIHDCGDLERALAAAHAAARPGDTVLLSPGCASYDQYRSYEERGDHFRTLVARLA